jgi:hypothetical protein
MLRLTLLSVALLFLLTLKGTKVTAQVPSAEKPSCVMDLSTLGYPAHPSENFSKTFGVAPTRLAFADSEHLVVTFISSDPGTSSEREGCGWRIVTGEPILPVIALRKWTGSRFRNASGGSETIGSAKRSITKIANTCPWRITELGQNHDAQRYCAPPPRIGQPLMLAWPDLWVRNAFERELLVERFPDVELHWKGKRKREEARFARFANSGPGENS